MREDHPLLHVCLKIKRFLVATCSAEATGKDHSLQEAEIQHLASSAWGLARLHLGFGPFALLGSTICRVPTFCCGNLPVAPGSSNGDQHFRCWLTVRGCAMAWLCAAPFFPSCSHPGMVPSRPGVLRASSYVGCRMLGQRYEKTCWRSESIERLMRLRGCVGLRWWNE